MHGGTPLAASFLIIVTAARKAGSTIALPIYLAMALSTPVYSLEISCLARYALSIYPQLRIYRGCSGNLVTFINIRFL